MLGQFPSTLLKRDQKAKVCMEVPLWSCSRKRPRAVYFVGTEILKVSVQTHILDTSEPRGYVTQQQHPHCCVFLAFKGWKLNGEASGPCRGLLPGGACEMWGSGSALTGNTRKCCLCSHTVRASAVRAVFLRSAADLTEKLWIHKQTRTHHTDVQ